MSLDVDSREIDLRKIERKAYLSYHQDGLIDILIGLFILGFGINRAMGKYIASLLCWSPILLFWPAKKFITYPRMGYVNFSPARKAKETKKRVVLCLLLFVPLILGIVVSLAASGMIGFPPGLVNWLKKNALILLGVMLAILISVGALLSGIKRLYVYGVFTLLAFVIGHLLNIPPHVYFISSGIIVLISGMAVLIRFLRKYPKIAEEVSHGKGN